MDLPQPKRYKFYLLARPMPKINSSHIKFCESSRPLLASSSPLLAQKFSIVTYLLPAPSRAVVMPVPVDET